MPKSYALLDSGVVEVPDDEHQLADVDKVGPMFEASCSCGGFYSEWRLDADAATAEVNEHIRSVTA